MNSNATTMLRTVKRPARTGDEPRYIVGIDAHSKVLAHLQGRRVGTLRTKTVTLFFGAA